MRTSDDLFQLIASLTKTEMRYCRMQLTQGTGRGARSTLLLFDAIARQKEYNEEKIRRELAGESFLPHLSVTKNQLHATILRSLRSYRAAGSDQLRLQDMIDGTQILLEKGLIDQAEKLLARTRRMAERREKFVELLAILYLERAIDISRSYVGVTDNDLKGRRREVSAVLRRIDEIWKNALPVARLSRDLLQGGPWREGEDLHGAEIASITARGSGQTLSKTSRVLYHEMHKLYYMLNSDFEKGYRNLRDYLAFVESSVDITDRQWSYATLLSDHIIVCTVTMRLKEARATYDKLYAFSLANPFRRLDTMISPYTARMDILAAEGDFRGIVEMAAEFREYCQTHPTVRTQQRLLTLQYNLAYAYTALDDYHNAAIALQPFLQGQVQEMRLDVMFHARLLQLIVHYELGDMDLLPYLCRSFYRLLHRKGRLFRFESTLLALMRKLPGITSRAQLVTAFRKARREIATFEEEREWRASTAFHIAPWLDATIEGKPFSEILARNRMRMKEEKCIPLPDIFLAGHPPA